MTKSVLTTMQIVLFACVLFSCKKERTQDHLSVSGAEGDCYEYAVPLWIGKTKTGGAVIMSNDASNIYVKVKLDEVINFKDGADNCKLWIGDDITKMAKIDCAPDLSKFPWKATAKAEDEYYLFTVSFATLSDLYGKPLNCSSKLIIVTAADLDVYSSSELAFGGNKVDDCAGQWWYQTAFEPICCQ